PEGFVRIADAKPAANNLVIVEGLTRGRYFASLRGFNRAAGTMLHRLAALDLNQNPAEPVLLESLSEIPVKGRIVLEDRPEEQQGWPLRGGLQLRPPRRRIELGVVARMGYARIEIAGTGGPFEINCVPGEVEFEFMGGGGAYIAGVSLDGRPLESR